MVANDGWSRAPERVTTVNAVGSIGSSTRRENTTGIPSLPGADRQSAAVRGDSALSKPKNALTKQYARLFDMEGVELEFRNDALKAIASRALERKTGARGLRSILESVLLETMYEIPSAENVSKVVIDENVISGDAKPLLIYETPEQPPKAVPED